MAIDDWPGPIIRGSRSFLHERIRWFPRSHWKNEAGGPDFAVCGSWGTDASGQERQRRRVGVADF